MKTFLIFFCLILLLSYTSKANCGDSVVVSINSILSSSAIGKYVYVYDHNANLKSFNSFYLQYGIWIENSRTIYNRDSADHLILYLNQNYQNNSCNDNSRYEYYYNSYG